MKIKIPIIVNSDGELLFVEDSDFYLDSSIQRVQTAIQNYDFSESQTNENELNVAVYWIKVDIPIPPHPEKRKLITSELKKEGDFFIVDESTIASEDLW